MKYRDYLLLMLVVAGVVTSLERFLFSIALEPIKADLSLSDTQLGLMTGIAFAGLYAIAGIPLARMADRGNRVSIAAITTGLLGVMVSLCGYATSFYQMLLVRAGVAIGEAGIVPAGQSLLSDYFDRSERPRAIGIFISFYMISMIIGYMMGGYLIEELGWRNTFILMGLPALLIALILKLTLREPRSDRAIESKQPLSSSASQVNSLFRQSTFRQILLAFCVSYFFNMGVNQWLATFLIRSHEMGATEVGAWLAVSFGVFGTLGTFAGGFFGTKVAANNERRQLKVLALAGIVSVAFALVTYLSDNKYIALASLSCFAFLATFNNGPIFAAIQSLVTDRMRSTAVAMTFLFANLIGFGLGPLALGILSDLFSARFGDDSLRYALAVFAPGNAWVAYHYIRASRTIEQDIAQVEELNGVSGSEQSRTRGEVA